MKITMGSLAKGATGATLLGGGIAGGVSSEQSQKKYSDFVKKLEEDINAEIEIKVKVSSLSPEQLSNEGTKEKLRCAYWTKERYEAFKSKLTNPKDYSQLTKEEKILKCFNVWMKVARHFDAKYRDLLQKSINLAEQFESLKEK